MAVIHISEDEASHDLPTLLAKVRQGEEIYIDDGDETVAILQPPARRKYPSFPEAMRLAKEENLQVLLDDRFGSDLEEIIERRRKEPRRNLWQD